MPTAVVAAQPQGASFVDLVLSRLSEFRTEQEKFHFLEVMAAQTEAADAGPIFRQMVTIAMSVLADGHPNDLPAWVKEAESCYGGVPIVKVTPLRTVPGGILYTVTLHGAGVEMSATAMPSDLASVCDVMRRNQVVVCARKLWLLCLDLRILLRHDGWLEDKFGHADALTAAAEDRLRTEKPRGS